MAKILDYGVWDHIALVCGPFFGTVESRSQYEARQCIDGRRSVAVQVPQAVTAVLPVVPERVL